MTERTTRAHLDAALAALRRASGRTAEPWTRGPDGHATANVGALYLEGAYGGYRLCEIVTEGGAVRDLTPRWMPAGEMWAALRMAADCAGLRQ